jgi:lactoylglutathione lyase
LLSDAWASPGSIFHDPDVNLNLECTFRHCHAVKNSLRSAQRLPKLPASAGLGGRLAGMCNYRKNEDQRVKLYLNIISGVLLSATLVHPRVLAAEDPGVAGINGTITFFYYDEIEAAAPFYGELLNLPLSMDEEWVKIYRITASSSVGLVQQGHGFHDVAEDKPAMLSIVVGDVDAWYARLKAAGATILKKLPKPDAASAEGSAPVRGFVAQDPGGYTVEFFTWQHSSKPAEN